MPTNPINQANFEIPENVFLAYPEFHKTAQIDIFIGVKVFYKLLCIGQKSLKNHPEAVLQKTKFGWIVAGEIKSPPSTGNVQCHIMIHSTPLQANLTRFWEIEEIPALRILSAEEEACEAYFKNNIKRNSERRYVVKLPFNESKRRLGKSFFTAIPPFNYLENRFAKSQSLKNEYRNFVEEYKSQDHMSLIKSEILAESGFYLPYYAVIKKDSLTTKTLVLFDGSDETFLAYRSMIH
ncbi:uncharacterized protein LOC117178623 [Belonocnema kinseyi]|uniref:uncharacterized protein LOC117178623 n=1 Tax=Belonocnema kinseyi TaxID=2817044 RepID=UPI00143DB053|nr:uncharacterized protein LOC117178623 [Belonocnema kinseyi]